jgi:hypothetical protein
MTYRGTAPFSEPENQAVRDLILAHPRILAHVDFHSYGQLILSRYGYISEEPPEPDRTVFRELNDQMAAAILAVHGKVYTAGSGATTLYTSSGGFADWAYVDQDILSWTLELRDEGTYGFLLPADQIIPTCEENFEAAKVLAGYVAIPFTFSFPEGLPARVTPNTMATISLIITEVSGTLDPATARVFTRIGTSGSFTSTVLTPLGGGSFEAVLPAAPCGAIIEYYFRAVSTTGSVRKSPDDAPAMLYEVEAIDTVVAMSDDMEGDSGWSVGAADDDATTGVWVRVDPNGTAAQPEDDHTPSGSQCWVTGQGSVGGDLGENDVDGGKTTLFSPTIDLTGVDAIISYWRWYSNDTGATPNTDVFVVDISNDDGGEWVNVETVGPEGSGTSGGWMYHEFRVSNVVEPSEEVILRFIASDEGDGSLVEAAIDDFAVSLAECGPQFLSVTAEGCRHIAITPPNESDPVALHLSSPQHPCLSKYVTANGTIADEPVLRSPLDWGIIMTRGAGIVPNTEYVVQPEDEFGAFVGPASSATTYEWGDITGTFLDGAWTAPNGIVDFQDVSAAVDRFRNPPTAPSLERCDIAPETPNGVVDFEDISYVVDAFRNLPYPFGLPCP